MRKLLTIIAVACVLGVLCANLFNRFVHPDIRFFQMAAEASDAWLLGLQRSAGSGRMYILAGGSEARFGLDPALLLREYGIASVNAGMTAGYGLRPNVVMALQYARPGDVLIGKIDLSSAYDVSVEGIRAAFYRGGFQAFSTPLLRPSASVARALLKSSSCDINSYVARRLFMSDHVYRYYNRSLLHESGWIEVQMTDAQRGVCCPMPSDAPRFDELFPLCLTEFTDDLNRSLNEKGVEFWVWCSPGMQHPSYRVFQALSVLRLVRMGYKVLRDDTFNVSDERQLFSDLPIHASALGTVANTRKLGRLIQNPDFWTEESLIAWLYLHGWDEQGRRLPSPLPNVAR